MASAQVKTAILTAGLLADGETVVVEPVVSRDHTEIMLGYLGAAIAVEPLGSGAPETAGRRITVSSAPYGAQDIDIPADISSAAFFIAAGILAGEDSVTVVDVGLNPTRAGFLEALSMMGAEISVDSVRMLSGEVVGEVTATRTNLQGAEIGGSMMPRLIDELPLLALLATQAEGRTTVRDASELRVKETDRITLVATELNRLGADITPTPDGFVIEGPTPLKGAVVRSHGDHRLAMMLAVAGLVAEGETVIEGGNAVDVSFPDFFYRLDLISLT
jgi:3-phosphoshikimate 1-carboxyvinyltransferase